MTPGCEHWSPMLSQAHAVIAAWQQGDNEASLRRTSNCLSSAGFAAGYRAASAVPSAQNLAGMRLSRDRTDPVKEADQRILECLRRGMHPAKHMVRSS